MLQVIFPEDSHDVTSKAIFMQDGASSHTSSLAMDWLRNHFPNKLISLKSEFLSWSARSPNLNPSDFFNGDSWRKKYGRAPHRLLKTWSNQSWSFWRQSTRICCGASLTNFANASKSAFALKLVEDFTRNMILLEKNLTPKLVIGFCFMYLSLMKKKLRTFRICTFFSGHPVYEQWTYYLDWSTKTIKFK